MPQPVREEQGKNVCLHELVYLAAYQPQVQEALQQQPGGFQMQVFHGHARTGLSKAGLQHSQPDVIDGRLAVGKRAPGRKGAGKVGRVAIAFRTRIHQETGRPRQ